ncbi:MAG: hypothetical protein Kow0010_24000 [Dehalococcoidia bacterium]
MSETVVHAARPPRPILERLWPAILLAGLLVLMAAWLSSPSHAAARLVWCSGDPVIRINGEHEVSVTVHVPVDGREHVDHAEVVFHIPRNTTGEVVFVDDTYFAEDVTIVADLPDWNGRSALRVEVEITVHASQSMQVAASTEDARAGTAWSHGVANRTFRVAAVAATSGRS